MLLVNFSNIRSGGALQVAQSVLNYFQEANINCIYLLSDELREQVVLKRLDNVHVRTFSLKSQVFHLRFINSVIERNKVDTVFTLFGPFLLLNRNVRHISGFADGWAYMDLSHMANQLRFFEIFKNFLIARIKLYILFLTANEIIVETCAAKNDIMRISSRLKIHVVQNSIHQYFLNHTFGNVLYESEIDLKFIYVAANHPHKNFDFIKKLANIIEAESLNWKIYLTLNECDFTQLFGSNNSVVKNLGYKRIEELGNEYRRIDAVIFPSLLETFSASFLEAWFFEKPIFVCDYKFMHNILGKKADFLNTNVSDRTILQIIKVMSNYKKKRIWKEKLLYRRDYVLKNHMPSDRFKAYLRIINENL